MSAKQSEVEVDIIRLDTEAMYEHLRSSTAVLQDILDDSRERESNIGFPCQQCHKYYKTEKTLQSHYLLKHPNDNAEVQCTHCDKKYPSTISLGKHVNYMHRYRHRCGVCYRAFSTKEHLEWHVDGRCVVTDSPCAACGKTFANQLALRNHVKYKHPEQRENWCHICRRVFTSPRGLSNHVNAMHTSCDTTCKVCKRAFVSAPALRSHVLYKHTETSARCDHCHKAFTSALQRGRHMDKFHKSNELVCYCKMCNEKFSTAAALLHHVVGKHSTSTNK